jgi:hypothetical protein
VRKAANNRVRIDGFDLGSESDRLVKVRKRAVEIAQQRQATSGRARRSILVKVARPLQLRGALFNHLVGAGEQPRFRRTGRYGMSAMGAIRLTLP